MILHLVRGALFPEAHQAANHFACRVAALPVEDNARMRKASASQHQKIAVAGDNNPLLRPRKLRVLLVGGAAQTGVNGRGDVNTPAAEPVRDDGIDMLIEVVADGGGHADRWTAR